MRSHVAGLSIWKVLVSPASSQDAFMASWMAKNTDAARNNGGSPTACKGYNNSYNVPNKLLVSHGASTRAVVTTYVSQITMQGPFCQIYSKAFRGSQRQLLTNTLDEKIALGLGALPNSATRKSTGIS